MKRTIARASERFFPYWWNPDLDFLFSNAKNATEFDASLGF